ncbi:hypothetical protein PanWU01x14_066900 [Parasponia andersonii]|uniref:Uncharacterized protein n=1 Tax=Parasponia andersonii TaxID=3476 RepID=A0A2P5DG90_PARAD|nr:hypothetical protein PanWU01x14_066900 [Parasponia andersonii]
MAALGLVLDGGGVDGDTTRPLLRRGVDFVVLLGGAPSHGGQGHGKGCSEGGLAVVDVADCADVDMGFLSLEFPTRRPDCEGPVVARGGHGGDWREVENGGGVDEGRREMGQSRSWSRG